jgi:1-acyl-sn-glycerol-3-phosphate acyltransferase
MLKRAIARCGRHGLSPIVFPEGTRSADGRLQPLKPGAFQLAVDGGFPIHPIAILGTSRIMPKGALGPRRSGPVVVRVGEPIPVEGLRGSAGRKILSARVRDALLALGVPEGEVADAS